MASKVSSWASVAKTVLLVSLRFLPIQVFALNLLYSRVSETWNFSNYVTLGILLLVTYHQGSFNFYKCASSCPVCIVVLTTHKAL